MFQRTQLMGKPRNIAFKCQHSLLRQGTDLCLRKPTVQSFDELQGEGTGGLFARGTWKGKEFRGLILSWDGEELREPWIQIWVQPPALGHPG